MLMKWDTAWEVIKGPGTEYLLSTGYLQGWTALTAGPSC